MSPRVSIIIPSYNHARWIHQAIDSVFVQTSEDWELLIVDDGSSDGSRDTIRQHPRIDDPRVRLFLNEDNAGQARRLNQAVAESRGEFVSLLASDDWYLPTKVASQLAAFDRLAADYGVVYGNGYRFYEDTGRTVSFRPTSPVNGDILPALFFDSGIIYPITPLVRRECFVQFPFWEEFRTEGEAVYWRIGMRWKFYYLDEYSVVMRAHTYNSGSDIYRLHKDVPAILRRVFDHPSLPPHLHPYRQAVLSQYLRKFAWNAMRQHSDAALWRHCLGEAFAESPSRVATDPRTWLGAAFAVIPATTRTAINAQLTHLRLRLLPLLRRPG